MNETTLNGQSADILSENIQKLKQIFPEVFCEERIDFEKLQAVLGEYSDDDAERYNFTWWGKSRALRLAQTPSMGTLRPCKKESKDWDTTENLYIEGDNLEVLKLLQKSYHGKVKMIYIDPPYNTGKDFVYKDDYKDPLKNYLEMTGQVDAGGKKMGTNREASGRYHTNWLNMIYPRLRLARNLLRDDGVIFISIDDNEVGNLRKLCNEIFGEENFTASITVKGNPRGRDYGGVARMHDYILVFLKTEATEINSLEQEGKIFPYKDEKGGYETRELRNRNIAFHIGNRPNLHYPFYINPIDRDENGFLKISLENINGWIEIFPKESQGYKTVWRWGKEKSLANLNSEIVGKAMENGGYQIVEKYRKTTKMARTIWQEKDVNTERGSLLVKALFDGKKVFPFPKPIEMIMRMVEMGSDETDIILDFFSGASTTAHSVMQQNIKDGRRRRFIMVQLPEPTDEKSEAYKAGYKNICEIGKERIRRAGEKIKAELQEQQSKQPSMLEDDKTVDPDDLDIGFKVFKLDSSNLKKWNPDYEHVEASLLDAIENFAAGRGELDVVYEIMLKYGIDLTFPIEEYEIGGKKIYSIGYGALIICLDNEITIDVANEIARLKEKLKPEVIRVVFKDNGFKDDSVKTNTKEILRNAGIDEIVSI